MILSLGKEEFLYKQKERLKAALFVYFLIGIENINDFPRSYGHHLYLSFLVFPLF